MAFSAAVQGGELFRVLLTDQGGVTAASEQLSAPGGAGPAAFDGINACSLADGTISVSVIVTHGGTDLSPFPCAPAVKNTSTLAPPVLDPAPPVTFMPTVEICGASRASTTVRIEGGASTQSIVLNGATTHFCLDVPLRTNQQNTLIVSAIDDLAAAPKPVASALPVQVVHANLSEIVIVSTSSRPLTTEEIETLVQKGVIKLDDPSNYNVSMFTIVFTIGSLVPFTITQPVAVPVTPVRRVRRDPGTPDTRYAGASVSYGGGGWIGGGGGSGGGGGGGGGCLTSCMQVIVIQPPTGPAIPGVIIIDGRIKTLKEFFQVTIALQNTSTSFTLTDMAASIALPPGLSPVGVGPGTDVNAVNATGEIDRVVIGQIDPGATGTGQFIIRGDSIGTYPVAVNFAGFLTGGGLPTPLPLSGWPPPLWRCTVRPSSAWSCAIPM